MNIDTVLSELITTGNKVTGDLAGSGRVTLASHIELKKALEQAQRALVEFQNGSSQKSKTSKASKTGKAKFYLLKHVIEILKPYIAKSSVNIIESLHIEDNKFWVTSLDTVAEVCLIKGGLGVDVSINRSNFKQIENISIGPSLWNVTTTYTGLVEYKGDRWNERSQLQEHFDSEDSMRAFVSETFADKEVIKVDAYRDDTISIRDGNKTVTVKGENILDRPAPIMMREVDWSAPFKASDIEAMARIGQCAATDDSRPTLTNVRVSITDGILTIAAADGYKLAKDEVPVDCPNMKERLIPASFLANVVKTLKKINAETCYLEFGWHIAQRYNKACELVDETIHDIRVMASAPELGITVKLTTTAIDGRFPDYEQLIPQKDAAACKVTMPMKQARAMVADIARVTGKDEDINKNVWFTVTPEECEILVNIGNDSLGKTLMPFTGIKCEGEQVVQHYNFTYFKELVNSLEGNTFELSIPSNTTHPTRMDTETGTAVIMPMHDN